MSVSDRKQTRRSWAEFCVDRPITTLVVIACVVVLGVISLQRLPLAFLPDVSWPSLRIWVPYRSSSPEEVERLITIPIEDMVSTVGHLKAIRSQSSQNGASISLEFEPNTDMDLMAVEIRDRLDRVRAQLPSDVDRIFIRRWQTTDMPVFLFSVSIKGSREDLYHLVNTVIWRRVQRIDGVANVDVRGVLEKQILVELDQSLMKAHHVDAYRLIQSLRANNINLSGGYVIDGGRKFTLRVIGQFEEIPQIGEIPIRGTELKLRDIARVRYDYPERRRFQHLNGREAVSLVVYKASTANVVEVCREVKRVIQQLRREYKEQELNIRVIRDQSAEILRSLNNLKNSGLFGAALAILVLFTFLRRVRTTLIITTAIPISVLFTFLIMYLIRMKPFQSSITLNLISMMGMVYAIGMLVDPAIVVLENIFRQREEGLDARNAAIQGSREVGTAVLAATLTTMIVFLPMILMSGSQMTRFIYEFGLVVCIVLFASLAIALTLIPLMASRLFTGREKPPPQGFVRLVDLYERIIRWTLRHRLITILGAVAVLGLSYFLYTQIDREFIPPAPSRRIDFRVDIPPSYTLKETQELFGRIERILLGKQEELDIEAVITDFGKGRSDQGGRGRLTLYLKPVEQSQYGTMEVVEKIQRLLPQEPGIRYRMGRLHGMGGEQLGVEVHIKGESPEVLALLAEEVERRIRQIPGIRDVDTNLEAGEEEIQVRVNRERANAYGLSSQRVALGVFSALSSRTTTTFKAPDREIDIQVQLREEDRANLEDLKNLTFQSETERMVPLYTVARFERQKGPSDIHREERQSVVTLTAHVQRMGLLRVSQAIGQQMRDMKFPPGYTWELGRTYRRWRQAEMESRFAIYLAVALIFMVMASLFESLIHPFTILISVPFAVIGVLLAFWITNTNLSSVATLGVLIVFGLVVNNGIILVDRINQLRRQGWGRLEAIVKGGRDRLRPILMTAATTNLGLLPLILPLFLPSVFGPIEGRAGIWAPVGLAIFGGLTSSTFLTLVILPTIYSLIDDLGRWVLRILRSV